MRSDDRDFVDDMLDDVTGGSVMANAPPGDTHSSGQTVTLPSGGSLTIQPKAAASSSGGGPDFGRILAGIATGGLSEIARAASGQPASGGGASSKPTLSTLQSLPASLSSSTPGPAIETPGVSVVRPPGDAGLSSIGVGDLASAVSSVTDPRLRSILGSIRAMRVQSEATSEHAALAAQDKFRKDVTARLARIESSLPAGGLRNQVSLVRSRIIPVMLG